VTISAFRLSCLAFLVSLWGSVALAQEAGLPGGASSLREVYGDWVVNCAMTGAGAEARKLCAMSQEQQDGETGQRVIALELQASAEGGTATLVLPFGLDLASGAVLQIDEGERGAPLAFRTCLPAGCLISTPIAPEMLAALRGGTALRVHAKADGGRDALFSLSLNGFGGAFDRTLALAG